MVWAGRCLMPQTDDGGFALCPASDNNSWASLHPSPLPVKIKVLRGREPKKSCRKIQKTTVVVYCLRGDLLENILSGSSATTQSFGNHVLAGRVGKLRGVGYTINKVFRICSTSDPRRKKYIYTSSETPRQLRTARLFFRYLPRLVLRFSMARWP